MKKGSRECKLFIDCLHDAQAHCLGCGWHMMFTGAMTREEVEAEYQESHTEKDTFERVSALGHFAMGTRKVKVIFRNGGHANNREGNEKAYWMDTETYRAIPLGTIAFIKDFKKHGEVVEAVNTDIYDIEEVK